MPKKIFEGLGPGTLIPQRGKLPVPAGDQQLGAEEGFVLSRVDGRTSLEEICLLVPFDEPVTMVILRRLWELGAIEVPGVARVLPRPTSSQSLPGVAPPPPAIVPSGDGHPIPLEQRRRIDAFYLALERKNAFELLEIDLAADGRAVKRAYFKLSKEFHPDRYFGREIGEYADRLSKIFQAVKAAFELLSHDERRAAYEEAAKLK